MFSHTFDFLTGDGGWINWVGTSWVTGQGWVGSRVDAQDFADHIQRVGFAHRVVTHVEFTYTSDACGGANCVNSIWASRSGTYTFQQDQAGSAGTHTIVWNGSADIDTIQLAANGGTDATSSVITSATISGIGIDPF